MAPKACSATRADEAPGEGAFLPDEAVNRRKLHEQLSYQSLSGSTHSFPDWALNIRFSEG